VNEITVGAVNFENIKTNAVGALCGLRESSNLALDTRLIQRFGNIAVRIGVSVAL
jgi:hypothetical protein